MIHWVLEATHFIVKGQKNVLALFWNLTTGIQSTLHYKTQHSIKDATLTGANFGGKSVCPMAKLDI